MANQQRLFPDDPGPTDPHVAAEEAPRLTGQNLAILQRLQRGPATNVELARIALKYTSRISDLRKAGYNVQIIQRDKRSGHTMYAIEKREVPF